MYKIYIFYILVTELFNGGSPEQSAKRNRRNMYGDMPYGEDDFPDDDDDVYGDEDDAYGYDDEEMHYRRQQQQQQQHQRRYYRQ